MNVKCLVDKHNAMTLAGTDTWNVQLEPGIPTYYWVTSDHFPIVFVKESDLVVRNEILSKLLNEHCVIIPPSVKLKRN